MAALSYGGPSRFAFTGLLYAYIGLNCLIDRLASKTICVVINA